MPPLCFGLSSLPVTIHSVARVSPGLTAFLKRQACSKYAMQDAAAEEGLARELLVDVRQGEARARSAPRR